MKKFTYLTLVFMLLAVCMHAQVRVLGVVVDKSERPIVGASIVVQGTTLSTITDIDGRFELRADQGAQLEISALGYKTQTVSVENADQASQLHIVLRKQSEGEHHRFAAWGAVGLCSPLEAYKASGKFMDQSSVGGGLGIGYQYVNNKLLIETGLEVMSLNYLADYNVYSYPTDVTMHTVRVQAPIMVGMELGYFYWLAGLKLGLFDSHFMDIHYQSSDTRSKLNFSQFNFAYTPVIELGANINRPAQKTNYKVALFAEMPMDNSALASTNLYSVKGWWAQTLYGVKFTVGIGR